MRHNIYIKGLRPDASLYEKREAERMDMQFHQDTEVKDGVVRWKSNGNIPPRDILEYWKYIGKEFDFDKTVEVNEKETSEFLQRYREANKNRQLTAEEQFEMRAAFGPRKVVVDIFSGRKFRT